MKNLYALNEFKIADEKHFTDVVLIWYQWAKMLRILSVTI